jgi:4'-phosphopantetheinyl transferase
MSDAAHLLSAAADVPDGDDWLGERERVVHERLAIPPRRASWRLGRWCGKTAAALWLGVAPSRVEILPAADGAPDVWLDGRPLPVSLTLSHRAGRALAVVGPGSQPLGCDVELIEPRSGAFVRQWLAPSEQQLVAATRDGVTRDIVANLIWTGKEAAAKVRRSGMRLELRRAVVDLEPRCDGPWRGLRVTWPSGESTTGWWRIQDEWILTVAGTGEQGAPRPLDPGVIAAG